MSEQVRPDTCRVLIVDDDAANIDVLHRCLESEGYRIHVARDGERALAIATRTQLHAILLDIGLPGMNGFEVCRCLLQNHATRHVPVIFITARDDAAARADSFRAGGVDYITKPIDDAEVRARVRVHIELAGLRAELERKTGELARLVNETAEINAQLLAEADLRKRAESAKDRADARAAAATQREAEQWGMGAIIGRSATINAVREEMAHLRGTTVGVLITGESGTGKELVARALHLESERAAGPFVALNCAAIPRELAESVLFGHSKGAFSGATADQPGYFAAANGGTLFLDEIGAMPTELQPKLLRALEEGRVYRVGDAQAHPIDARVIAATNADPAREIEAGRLRADLYFRLARFTLSLPPLRERPEDVSLLADHFLSQFAREMGRARPALDAEARIRLQHYSFPGNVRELRNMMEHALLRSRDGTVTCEHIHFLAPVEMLPYVAADSVNDPADLILAFLATRPTLSNTQARTLLNVDARRASYILDQLVREGRLVRTGARRWARYELPPVAGL